MSHASVERPVRSHRLKLVVDHDERGIFRAHVEDEFGKYIFEFSNEDDDGSPSVEGLWLIEFGYMRHARDAHGLMEYLQEMGIARSSATLSVEG